MANAERHTPLYASHVQRGARMMSFAGWSMPLQYTGIVHEHTLVRTRAGLFDVSHMGEIRVHGPDAAALLNRVVTGDANALAVGRAMYTLSCNSTGGIEDDLIVYRQENEAFLIICNAANRAKIVQIFSGASRTSACHCEDISDAMALLALQGPKACNVLQAAGFSSHVLDLPRFAHTETTLDGMRLWPARTGYTGEDGFELVCQADDAERLWERLLTAGSPLGLEPAGLGARDTLRLEACLPLYGQELDAHTHPFEAGLGWTVDFAHGDFIGREALLAAKSQPLRRKLVAFEMVERGVARHGYAVVTPEGERLGEVTSGSPSPTLGKNIGLAFVPPQLSDIGSVIHIEIRAKRLKAQVVKRPFYKRQDTP